jgi:branched-chain amino acid aminotransferase
MKECLHHKFILDGEIADCERFSPEMIDVGTSIYEVVHVMKGKILFVRDHLKRLEQSALLAGLDIWHTTDSLQVMVSHLPALNGITEGNIKIVLNYNPAGLNKFLAYFVTHHYPSQDQFDKGVALHTYRFTRTDPHTKIWRPKHRLAVKEYIQRNDLYEVLLFDDHDRITEASKANVFFISENTVITPPVDLVLPGITRKYILQLCRDQNIAVKEDIVSINQLPLFDAAFITGTSPKVLPVSHVNEHIFNVGHPVLRVLMKEYDGFIELALKSSFRK